MDNQTIATLTALAAILTALAAVIVVPMVSLYITKRQINASVVSANRQRWIDDLRNQLSEIISLFRFINLGVKGKMIDKDGLLRKIERAVLIETKIKLLINPKEKDHVELTSLIRSVIEEIFKNQEDRQTNKLLDIEKIIVERAQEILKREWDRVKKGE